MVTIVYHELKVGEEKDEEANLVEDRKVQFKKIRYSLEIG